MRLEYIEADGVKSSDTGWRMTEREANPPEEREIVVEDLPFRKNPLYFPNLGRWYSRRELSYEFDQPFQHAAEAVRGADAFMAWLGSIDLTDMKDSLGDCTFTNVRCTSLSADYSDNVATVKVKFVADPYKLGSDGSESL